MGDKVQYRSWLQSSTYHIVRIALVVFACVLLAVALVLMTLYSKQGTHSEELSIEMVRQSELADALILTSGEASDAATQLQEDAVSSLLQSAAVSVDVCYLDAFADGRGYADGGALVNSASGNAVRAKLAEHGAYNIVVCVDDEALSFVDASYEQLFYGTPVVFLGINNDALAQSTHRKGYATGLVEGYNSVSFIDIARRMRPDANRVVVVTDNTLSGQGKRAQIESAVASHPSLGIEVINASDMSRSELAARLAQLTDDCIVVYASAQADNAGNAYSAANSAYFVSQSARQPVFSATLGGVGEGFAGSGYIDYTEEGTYAGNIAIDVLNGQNPANIPVVEFVSEGYVFDAKQLAAAGISTGLVPASATLLNQSGFSFDAIKPLLFPIVLLALGLLCIGLFALIGYRRSMLDMRQIMGQNNMLEQHFYKNRLTDIPNMQWLTAFASSDAAAKVRSIVAISLLGVETIDETYGPGMADSVIKRLAKRLEGIESLFLVQPSDSEFILGINHDLKLGGETLGALNILLSQPVEVNDEQITAKTCIAVCNRESTMSVEEMVAGVEIAIGQAVQLGNTEDTIFYDRDLRSAVEDKLEITSAIKKAIDDESFFVVYQPQIDLQSNSVVGYEALVRMKNDLYTPEEFIAVAEVNGQIAEIDRLVSRMVVQQLAKWKRRKQRMRPVTINHALGQLRDGDYIDFMVKLLEKSNVAPSMVCFDLKENLFTNNMAAATAFADELREKGFSIAIDGFGAGYMSVQRVLALPAEIVKIDTVLTESFLLDGEDGVVGNLVRLVHSANKKVVIEGVETLKQVEMCRALGCDVVQGFYFAQPMLPERAVQYKPPEPVIGVEDSDELIGTASASKTSADPGEELIGEASEQKSDSKKS